MEDESLVSGLRMFVRYAYPPNERGYCGPDDHQAMLDYLESGTADPGLLELARTFEGPWPYLQLMAERTGIGDPFSERIVEAYWIGNDLLDRVDTLDFGNTVEERFRPRVGRAWPALTDAIPGGVPHHSFHVFVTYPWVGLLDSGRGEPLQILDRCRIRWGTVVGIEGGRALVDSRPLQWDGHRLSLGEVGTESVALPIDEGPGSRIEAGDTVSMHWDWVCDRLTPRQLVDLRRFSARQLTLTNRMLADPTTPARLS